MRIGEAVHRLATCSSTNDIARDLADAGAVEGTVVLAEEQTGGRGTKGRAWFSPPGLGLYLSVVLRPQQAGVALFPLLAGLAVKDALKGAGGGLDVTLKWPNDVVWQGLKLGGILCESSWAGQSLNHVVIGLGLNLHHRAEDFPAEIRESAVSLRMALAAKPLPELETFLQSLYQSLARWYDVFQAGRLEEIVAEAETALDLSRGSKVVLTTEQGPIDGDFQGIRPDGAIALKVEGRKRAFSPSEVISLGKA